jgi:hypothetical protein
MVEFITNNFHLTLEGKVKFIELKSSEKFLNK